MNLVSLSLPSVVKLATLQIPEQPNLGLSQIDTDLEVIVNTGPGDPETSTPNGAYVLIAFASTMPGV